jgi:hypothetical protein
MGVFIDDEKTLKSARKGIRVLLFHFMVEFHDILFKTCGYRC